MSDYVLDWTNCFSDKPTLHKTGLVCMDYRGKNIFHSICDDLSCDFWVGINQRDWSPILQKTSCLFLFCRSRWWSPVFENLTFALAQKNKYCESLYGGQFTLSTQLIKPKFSCNTPHRRSTTVSLKFYLL